MGLIYTKSFGGSNCVGRIDNSGNVYTGSFGGSYMGKVNSNGYVLTPDLSVVGRINSSGQVYTGASGGSYKGKVDSSGNIYDNSGLFFGSIIAKAEPPNQRAGGAAYLILLR